MNNQPSLGHSEKDILAKVYAYDRAGKKQEAASTLKKAADTGDIEAITQYGLWLALGHNVPEAPDKAFQHIMSAAKSNYPIAQRLCANFYATGLGTEENWDSAGKWLIKAAKNNDARALCSLAELINQTPKGAAVARDLLCQAATSGDRNAACLLGLDLITHPEEQDRKIGRWWLRLAAEHGSNVAYSLLAAEAGKPLSAPKALKSAKINWNDLYRYIRWPHDKKTVAAETVSKSPVIFWRKNLLTKSQCQYMRIVGETFLTRATVNDTRRGQIVHDSRSNSFMNFYLLESDPFTVSIDRLMAKTVDGKARSGDALSLLHYQPGQSYAPHCDYFDPNAEGHKQDLTSGGQRTDTVLLYLNDNYDAGETYFTKLQSSFKGATGDALIFKNVCDNGMPNPMTEHTGLSPENGEKWILSKWIREK